MTLEQTITDELIHEFSKTIEMFGISPSDARLFTILYLNQQPMTLDEMSQVTGKSKTSVNTGIRNLFDLNLVKQVWKKGVRKNLYTADEDLYQRFMQAYLNKWMGHINLQKQTITQIREKANKRSQGDLIEDRIKRMLKFHSLIEETFKEMHNQTKKRI
ncbi:transcriptional regulator [Amphibacillus sp. MSJ-3]|uniref:GbsR/MarR family transcriptional regulator n=1 Tax=Amphibacillus sp. MSJ-3 TaxID=2841505 RepID=UPI001C0EE7E0|nr:helix-turn-helix domain-containing protein [Amphibacillus sp. MSJ-3]MBU5594001.1 transcriptional regulator [Amphibacillus sp. MSJ-3]